MSGSLDGDFVVWLALARVHRGGVVKVSDRFYYRHQPMPPGLLALALDALIEGGLLRLTAPEGEAARVSLTDEGATCYAELSAKQQAALQVPPPEHASQTPADRRSSATPLAPPGGRPDPL